MQYFKALFCALISFGTDQKRTTAYQKEIVLLNKISLFLIPIAFVGLVLSFSNEVYFATGGFSLLIILFSSVFPLNKMGKSKIARISLSILPPLFLLIPIVMSGAGNTDNYTAFSYIFIGLTIIPLVLFYKRKGEKTYSIILFFHFAIILFFDALIDWGITGNLELRLFGASYIYYKLPQVVLWALIVGACQFMKSENEKNKQELLETNEALQDSNQEAQRLKEKNITQNLLLGERQSKIDEQDIKINELSELTETLKGAQEKLKQSESEAKSILNALNKQYLIAQYDLSGNLLNINTRVAELLSAVRNKLYHHAKPIIDKDLNNNGPEDSNYFAQVWEKIKNGESVTLNLNLNIEGKTKYLATTFTALFDSNNNPYEVLAIGQDVTEHTDKSAKLDKINKELKEKLSEINQKSKLLNFQQKDIFEKNEKLKEQKEEIQAIVETLEMRVKERTAVLETKNRQLTEYAFINSHVLRSPVSTIMGLINLISYSTLPEEDQMTYEYLKITAQKLDDVVVKINNAIDSRIHFDRTFLRHDP